MAVLRDGRHAAAGEGDGTGQAGPGGRAGRQATVVGGVA